MAVVSKNELIKLQKSLGTDLAIAKKFKVTRQAIQQFRQKYGIDSRYANNPQRNKEMVSLFKAGKTGREIAKKFGVSRSQTYRLIGETRGKKS
jgi:DNA invertase Pin-like site-specific DNA recombinase